MARIIVALVFLLVVAGAVVGGLYVGKIGPFAEHKTEGAAGEAAKPEEPKVEMDLKKVNVFVDLDPLSIPMFNNGKVEKQVIFVAQLEVTQLNQPYVAFRLPKLQNVLLIEFYDWLPRHMAGRVTPDLDLVKRKIKYLADTELGEGRVEGVLIKASYER